MPPTEPCLAAPATIRVALLEDEPGMRARLEHAIGRASHLQLACACGSAREMRAWLAEQPVDVLLVDLGLPDGSGIDVIVECKRLQPACEVMVITMFGDETNMMKAFSAGANGYLLKDGTEDDLAAHITNLRNGGSPMSPIIARQLLGRLGPAATPQPPPTECPVQLSPKEAEVLGLVARGFSYGEVAGLLKISVNTVHTHARNIYGKLSVKSKTEAVFEARQLGLLRH